MPLVTTDAVVLHGFNYLESSRIIRFATRDAGLQSVIARGARSSHRRFGLGLDLFAGGVAQIQLRPGRELQQLVGFDLVNARGALSADLERFAAASALAELTMRFATTDEPGDLLDSLNGTLDALAAAPASRARDVGLAGAWHLVATLGFAPAIDSCCSCHRTLEESETVTFCHESGGAACTGCAAQLPRGRALPTEAREALRAWTMGGRFAEERPAMRRSHLRLLREFLEHHLSDGKPLHAFASWERGATVVGGVR